MLALVLAAAAPLVAAGGFDLADLDRHPIVDDRAVARRPRHLAAPIEQDRSSDAVPRFRLRWKRIKVTMPLLSL